MAVFLGERSHLKWKAWCIQAGWRIDQNFEVFMEIEIDGQVAKKIPWAPMYAVTAHGEVYSLRGKRPKRMKQTPNGYPQVHLYSKGVIDKVMQVHQLVAELFLPPRLPEQYQVHHIDGNKRNPIASNLKWGNMPGNMKDRDLMGRCPTKSSRRLKTGGVACKLDDCQQEEVIRMLTASETVSHVARTVGVDNTVIYRVLWAYLKSRVSKSESLFNLGAGI